MEQIEATSNDLVKEMPSLKALGKDLAAQEAAVEKQLAAVRTEAERTLPLPLPLPLHLPLPLPLHLPLP